MSDAPQGPGWYQAADGRWYPPQGAVAYAPPGQPGPPPTKSSGGKILLIVAGVLLGLCVLGGGGCAAIIVLASNSTTTVPGGTAANPGGPGSAKASPAPVGTAVRAAKDWDVTVNSAERNANESMQVANEFNKPDAGKQFVLVNVTVVNRSGTPESILSNVKMTLLTPSGADLDSFSCLAETPRRLDTSTQLQPGGSLTGNLCFQVTPAEAQASVLLAEPTFTLDEVKDQRFLSLG